MSALIPFTTTGVPAALDGNYPSDGQSVNARKFWLFVYGTWDGATMKLQFSPDNGTTWFDYTSGSFTANGFVSVTGGVGLIWRVNLSNDGATTSLTAIAAEQ